MHAHPSVMTVEVTPTQARSQVCSGTTLRETSISLNSKMELLVFALGAYDESRRLSRKAGIASSSWIMSLTQAMSESALESPESEERCCDVKSFSYTAQTSYRRPTR